MRASKLSLFGSMTLLLTACMLTAGGDPVGTLGCQACGPKLVCWTGRSADLVGLGCEVRTDSHWLVRFLR